LKVKPLEAAVKKGGSARAFLLALDRDPFDHEAKAARIDRDINTLTRLSERVGERPGDPEQPFEAAKVCLRNGQKAGGEQGGRLQSDEALERGGGEGGGRGQQRGRGFAW